MKILQYIFLDIIFIISHYMAMHHRVERLFNDVADFFTLLDSRKTGMPDFDEAMYDIASQGAIDLLGTASVVIQYVPSGEQELKSRFSECAQKLIDYLEDRGHPNILKEVDAIRVISRTVPVRIPDKFPSLQ